MKKISRILNVSFRLQVLVGFIVVISTGVMTCCTPEKDCKLKQNINEWITRNAGDPNSYQQGEDPTVFGDTAETFREKGCYIYLYVFRINNEFGALTKQQVWVKTDQQFKIISIRETYD